MRDRRGLSTTERVGPGSRGAQENCPGEGEVGACGMALGDKVGKRHPKPEPNGLSKGKVREARLQFSAKIMKLLLCDVD